MAVQTGELVSVESQVQTSWGRAQRNGFTNGRTCLYVFMVSFVKLFVLLLWMGCIRSQATCLEVGGECRVKSVNCHSEEMMIQRKVQRVLLITAAADSAVLPTRIQAVFQGLQRIYLSWCLHKPTRIYIGEVNTRRYAFVHGFYLHKPMRIAFNTRRYTLVHGFCFFKLFSYGP